MSARLHVKSPGARLAVDVDGVPPVSVLLCHGGPGAPDDLAGLRDVLTDQGASCARFDQRGVGGSSCDDDCWHVRDYAEDLEATRQQIGTERVIVVGHSRGGVVACEHARSHPEHIQALLLLSPSPAIGPAWAAMET